jgi:hypothetical protein
MKSHDADHQSKAVWKTIISITGDSILNTAGVMRQQLGLE